MGAFCYYRIGVKIYEIGIILILIATVTVFLLFYNDQEKRTTKNNSLIGHVKESFGELSGSKLLQNIILITMITQIFFQTHYQLWQAFFLEKGLDKKYFASFYAIFQLISILAYSVPLDKLGFLTKSKKKIFVPLVGLVLTLPLILLLKVKLIIFPVYGLFVFIFTVFEFYCGYRYTALASAEHLSALTSLNSTISRLVSILVVSIMGLLLRRFTTVEVVIFNFFSSFLLICLVFKLVVAHSHSKKAVNICQSTKQTETH